ncbi:MAG: hypothetical protein WCY24_00755 [Lutispora sp.]
MKRKFIYIILILSIMMYTFGSSSMSWFSSTAASGDNTFTVGTLDIGIGDGEKGSGEIDLGQLAPDTVIEQRIKIVNKGTLPCKLYGIRFSEGILAGLSDLSDALNFHIYFTYNEGEEIIASDIPVFYNYVNTIKDNLIIFYPIIIDKEITITFRAELDQLQIEEKHTATEESILEFEILASQLDTPLKELSERYKLLEDYTDIQGAINDLDDGDVLVVGEGQYECDRLLINSKENISIVGIGEKETPEFKHIEKNKSERGNLEQYFLRVDDCRGIIMRNIALGYYKKNKELSVEALGNGNKPNKPLYIDGDYNQVNVYFQGQFAGNANPGHIEILGRNNIIFIDEIRYNPPQS